MNEKGNRYTRTGDLNFAAACMAIGVPLWQQKPVTVTLREGLPDHGSWNLHAESIDGHDPVSRLSEWWSKPTLAPPTHPFALVMTFVGDRPKGISGTADWLWHAHSWLSRRHARPLGAPKKWQDIESFVARSNNSLASYVFAFVHNRQTCLDLYHKAAPEIEMTAGKRITRVGVNLDKRQAANLIARMKG